MATRHRKDMNLDDFRLLAWFVHALSIIGINNHAPYLELGVRTMLLPTWYLAAGIWKLAAYKEYNEAAIGISRNHFETICCHMGVRMNDMLDVLYRFSMLAVIPDSQTTDAKPRYRQPFDGIPPEYFGFDGTEGKKRYVKGGFVIEKRRAMGGFRKQPEGGGNVTGINYP